jgi:hypothetical protein
MRLPLLIFAGWCVPIWLIYGTLGYWLWLWILSDIRWLKGRGWF